MTLYSSVPHRSNVLLVALAVATSACVNSDSEPPPPGSATDTVTIEDVEEGEHEAVPAAGSSSAIGLTVEAGLYLDSNGLAVVSESGETRHLGFGMAEGKLLVVTENMWGPPDEEAFTMEECGAGPIDFLHYANGVSLHFQDGVFVGWGIDSADVTTMDGIGLGTTVGALEATLGDLPIEETTLGYEFVHERLHGIVTADTPDGVVETLWGGVVCTFR